MFQFRQLTEQTFTSEDVKEHLKCVCSSNSYVLPHLLDSWHGFESKSPSKLGKLGALLERKYGWRYIGSWELSNSPGIFHARVAKEGVYDEEAILNEIPFMKKMANKCKVEFYTDCAPQPTLL